MKVLVVGGDGRIAGSLLAALRGRGTNVAWTSRRGEEGGAIPLDLAAPEIGALPGDATHAVICAGITQIAACENSPAASRHVNVAGVLRVAEALVARGTRLIYLSSSAALGARCDGAAADDTPAPVNEYGRQKLEVERALLALGCEAVVLRITKVLFEDWGLIAGWARDLEEDVVIRPFSNMRIAPISYRVVIDSIFALMETTDHRFAGLWQCSAPASITYEGLALLLCRSLDKPERLVQGEVADVARLGHGGEFALDSKRLQALGVRIPSAEQAFAELYLNQA